MDELIQLNINDIFQMRRNNTFVLDNSIAEKIDAITKELEPQYSRYLQKKSKKSKKPWRESRKTLFKTNTTDDKIKQSITINVNKIANNNYDIIYNNILEILNKHMEESYINFTLESIIKKCISLPIYCDVLSKLILDLSLEIESINIEHILTIYEQLHCQLIRNDIVISEKKLKLLNELYTDNSKHVKNNQIGLSKLLAYLYSYDIIGYDKFNSYIHEYIQLLNNDCPILFPTIIQCMCSISDIIESNINNNICTTLLNNLQLHKDNKYIKGSLKFTLGDTIKKLKKLSS